MREFSMTLHILISPHHGHHIQEVALTMAILDQFHNQPKKQQFSYNAYTLIFNIIVYVFQALFIVI
jgi:hypothetical protein